MQLTLFTWIVRKDKHIMGVFSGFANSVLTMTASGKHIIANAGIAIAGKIFGKAGFERFDSLPTELAHPANVYQLSDCVKAEVASMCCGDPSFEGIYDIRSDADFYAQTLNMANGIPSAERTRQRLDQCVQTEESFRKFHNAAVLCNRDMIREEELTCWNGYLPVDMDVTPFDESKSHKGNISRTYHNFVGYAPNYMYCGQEGFMVATEFRPGNQHCQKGTVAFIEQSIETIRDIYPVGKVLFRMDSGNDSLDNYLALMDKGMYFICKRNLRSESVYDWLDHAKKYTLPENISNPREGKTVYIGSTWIERSYRNASGNTRRITLRAVYEITERTMEPNGQLLMPPSVEVNMFTTNADLTDAQVIEGYHDHATCEQFHAELKSDLDFEKVPSGKYLTNCVLNDLAMFAFNTLRCIGMRLYDLRKIPKRGSAFRRKISTVIHNIMHAPAIIATHAGYRKIDLGGANRWAEAIIYVFDYYSSSGCTRTA